MRHYDTQKVLLGLAVSFTLVGHSAWAAPPINTYNNGPVINSGTYLNTADSKTTFANTAGTGVWLKSGSNIRGTEVTSGGAYTGNGGTFQIFAPGQVVRLDGNIDVRGLKNGSGAYMGNGGKVFVDSAYLFQSGKIYADGQSGGLVQFDVGSATLAGNALISAQGTGIGKGGIIAINASGPVDIQRQVVLDTSGKVAGSFDTNIINIEGGLVNVEGTLRASGFVKSGDEASPGGTIRLVSTGQSDLTQTQQAVQKAVTGGTLTSTEGTAILNREGSLKSNNDGDILIASASSGNNQATLTAHGGWGQSAVNDPVDTTVRAGDGGTIILSAQRNVTNGGWLTANGGNGEPVGAISGTNGGNGGTISVNAGQVLSNSGRMTTDGGSAGNGLKGGNGGLIALSYGTQMSNSGAIRAQGVSGVGVNGKGGNGGLIVLSGSSNPLLNGAISALGGGVGQGGIGAIGTIAVSDPATSSNLLLGAWRKTDPIELLSHNENIILLRNGTPVGFFAVGGMTDNMASFTYNARVRTTSLQYGDLPKQPGGPAMRELLSKTQKFGATTGPDYLARNLIFANTTDKHIYFSPYGLAQGNLSYTVAVRPFNTMTLLSAGIIDDQTDSSPFGNGMGGGHLSVNSSYYSGYVFLNGGIAGGSANIATTTQGRLGYRFDDTPLHGGSLIVKTPGRIDRATDWNASGTSMGGTMQIFAGTVLNSTAGGFGSVGIQADGLSVLGSGGSILLRGPEHIANGSENIEANGGLFGGSIRLQTNAPLINGIGIIQATGSIQNGQVVLEPVP